MKNELEKVSEIQVRAKLLNPDDVSDMSNTIILVGMFGLLMEANMQKFNPLITTYFILTILYGITAEILGYIKPGKENISVNNLV